MTVHQLPETLPDRSMVWCLQLKALLVVVFLCIGTPRSFSQITASGYGQKGEVWPEADLYYTFNKTFRLFAMVSGTQIKETSNYADGSLGLFIDYFSPPILKKVRDSLLPKADFWLRGGYFYSASTPYANDEFKYHLIDMEGNLRTALRGKTLLTAKFRFDWKVSAQELTLRTRPKLTIEHDFKTAYLSFNSYFYGEYFWEFSTPSLNRLRVCLGSEFKITRVTNLEFYYLRQFKNGDQIPDVNAVGVVVKFYLPRPNALLKRGR